MMMASQKILLVMMPERPLLVVRVTIRPAGPTANTVPTMISRMTEKTRITFFIVSPR